MISENKFRRPLNADQKHLLTNIRASVEDEGIEAVSFEMFDTLVLRPFFERHDICFFMEKEFKGLYVGNSSFYELRYEAENYAAEKAVKKKTSYNMDDIYKRLKKLSKISPSSSEKLMKRECELEEYFCFARDCGMELYKAAKAKGHKIIITADTYLPEKTVKKILNNCGYTDYDMLFITGECGAAKAPDGTLYEKILTDSGIMPHKILHLGCSFENDAEAPIKKGLKSVFITSCRDRLIKSGRLCGYIQKQLFYDFNTEKYLSLRCILGLYAAYAFGYPHGKTPHSDFCSDDYMLGFAVLGAMSVYKDFVISSEIQAHVLGALSEKNNIYSGQKDFEELYSRIFGDNLEKYSFDGCCLPFEFYAAHGAVGDRMLIQEKLSKETAVKWANEITEPELAPVVIKQLQKNAFQKFADKMFPEGTYVRKITDKILAKIH